MSKRGISLRRVSTDEQSEKGYSLPTQLEEIEAYAAKHDIDLVGDFAGHAAALRRGGQDRQRGSQPGRPGGVGSMKFFVLKVGDVFVAGDGARYVKIPVIMPGASWDPVNAMNLATRRYARFGALAEVERIGHQVLKLDAGVLTVGGPVQIEMPKKC
jgi:hypothetical protein